MDSDYIKIEARDAASSERSLHKRKIISSAWKLSRSLSLPKFRGTPSCNILSPTHSTHRKLTVSVLDGIDERPISTLGPH